MDFPVRRLKPRETFRRTDLSEKGLLRQMEAGRLRLVRAKECSARPTRAAVFVIPAQERVKELALSLGL